MTAQGPSAMTKGIYRQVGHCGNRGVWNPECMIGCEHGWCMFMPAELEAEMVKHRKSLADERAQHLAALNGEGAD